MLRIALPFTFMTLTYQIPGWCRCRKCRGNLPADRACRNLARIVCKETPVAAIDYEAEYNNRARVPEHPEIFARWAGDSEFFRVDMLKSGRAELGLSYGDTPKQYIDLFLPEAGEAA